MPGSKFIDKKDAAKIYGPYSNEYVQKLANGEETLVSAKSSPETKKNVSVDELKSKFPNQIIGTTQPTITPSAVQKIASLQGKTDATIGTVNIDKTAEFIKNEDIKRENLLKEDSIKGDVARLEENIPYVGSKIAGGVSDFMKRGAGKILGVDFDEAGKQATETQVMQDKLTLSSPELISAANNIKNIVKGTYAESLVQSPEIEFETSPEGYLARTKSAAADRWNKTIIKYGNKMGFDWDEVEFTDTKQVNVANLFNNKWLSNDGKTIFLNNGNTTIELPVIETTDYKELVSDAYNGVTNRLATEGVLTTPDELRKFYPEWEDVSDDELNRFINACGYDVQEGKRRDINEYYENFKDMAFTESYTSQNDNMIQLLSNETFQNYGAGMFIGGVEKLEGITGKELQEYIYAASQLSARAEVIKSKGYAPDGASDYAILSTYSRQYPELKKILNTYNKYKLSEKDFAELTYTYSKNMQDTEDFVTKVTGASTKELKDIWKREARAQITKYTSEISNAWVKEQVTNDTGFKYGAKIPILGSMIVGNYYKVGNKYFDLDGNEMKPSEAEMSFADKWLNSLIGLGSNLNELEIDYQTYRDTGEGEYLGASASDAISASFNGMMAFTPGGLKFYAKTYIPFYGEMLEGGMGTAMEFLGDAGVFLTDYAGITQGRTAENKDKLRDAFGGLTFMLLEHYRAKLKGTILEKYRDKTAIKKGIDAMKNKFEETIKMYDLMGEMSKGQHKPDIEKQEETIKQIDEELKTKIEEINKKADMPEDVKKDEIKRAQEEAKIKKDQAKNTQKYLKETEQEENKKIDKEVTQGKLEFTKEFFKNLVTEFNNTFREEYSKNRKASEAGERSENSILDALYKSLIDRTNALQEIRTRESRGTAEKTGEKTAQENVPAELPTAEQVTTETAQESTKQTSISEQKIETPETRVEVTGEKPSEEIKGTVTTEGESEQVKQQINSIADVIKKIVDESQKMFVKMLDGYISILDATSPYANKIGTAIGGTTGKIAKKISNRQTEIDMKKDYNAMIEMGLDESQIDIIQNNPYTPALIRIAKEKYGPSKYDPKKIVKKGKTSTDEIQRDVLSEGVKQIQEYINFLIKNKKEISRVYKELSKDGIIDVKEFVNSPEFKEILKNTNIDVEFRMRETEKGELRMGYQAFSKDGQKLNVNEQAAADYLEEMFNKHIGRRNISENEAQSIRSFFTSDGDWNKTGKFDKGIAKNLHHAWNQYIEKQGGVELLRKLDKAFNDLSDKLEMFEDMLDKDNNIKDSVKTKMFEWSETEISEMETIVPGIGKLIELAKASPDIVNKIIDSALKTKKTRQWIAQPVRYTFVALPSIFGGIKFGLPGLIAGSFVFKRSEMLGGKLSNLITGKTPDLKDLNRLVDALNVDESTKSQYKRQMQEDFEELSKIFQDKNEAEINQIWQEITDIQLEREARRIAEEQAEIDRINKLKSEIEQAEQEKQAKEKAGQEELEKQKGSQAPRLGTQETHRLPQRENIQETPASVSEEGETIISTPEGKNIVFKKGEDVRLDQISKTIIQASISPETESASPEAQKGAEILNRIQNNTADIMKDSVGNDVMEKGEAPTQENINKEASTATPSIEDFISEMEKGDTSSDKPTKPNFKKVSYNTLLQFFDKDGNVKPEFKEYEQELNEAMMYHESNRGSKGEFTSPATVKKRERKLKNVEEGSNERDNLRQSFTEDFGISEIGGVDDAYLDQEMGRIKHTSDADTGRGDNYNTMLAEEMLGKKPQGSVSNTSKLELIEQLPAGKRKVNMLKTKWERTKKVSEKQKIYEAYKKAEAEREEQKTKKKELAEQYKEQVKIQKDENSTTQERKTAQKKKEELADEFDKLGYEIGEKYVTPEELEKQIAEESIVSKDTDKNTEKPQVVSSENELKTTQETKVEQEPTTDIKSKSKEEILESIEEISADRDENGNLSEENKKNLKEHIEELVNREDEIKFSEQAKKPMVMFDGTEVYKGPTVGERKTADIKERIDYIKEQKKKTGKLYGKDIAELEYLSDLYKRQVEREARPEASGEITEKDLENLGAGGQQSSYRGDISGAITDYSLGSPIDAVKYASKRGIKGMINDFKSTFRNNETKPGEYKKRTAFHSSEWEGEHLVKNFDSILKTKEDIHNFNRTYLKDIDNRDPGTKMSEAAERAVAETIFAVDTNFNWGALRVIIETPERAHRDLDTADNEVRGHYVPHGHILKASSEYSRTLQHEIGHSVDATLMEELIGINHNSETIIPPESQYLTEHVDKMSYSELGSNFTLLRFKQLVDRLKMEGWKYDERTSKEYNEYAATPRELFARFFDAFVMRTKGKGNMSEYNEMFSDESFHTFEGILSDIAKQRENGDLNGTENLGTGKYKEYLDEYASEFRVSKNIDPQIITDIKRLAAKYGIEYNGNNLKAIQALNKKVRKNIDHKNLTADELEIYDLKDRYIWEQLRITGQKVIDQGEYNTVVEMKEGKHGARLHVGDEYPNLKQQGYTKTWKQAKQEKKDKKNNQ